MTLWKSDKENFPEMLEDIHKECHDCKHLYLDYDWYDDGVEDEFPYFYCDKNQIITLFEEEPRNPCKYKEECGVGNKRNIEIRVIQPQPKTRTLEETISKNMITNLCHLGRYFHVDRNSIEYQNLTDNEKTTINKLEQEIGMAGYSLNDMVLNVILMSVYGEFMDARSTDMIEIEGLQYIVNRIKEEAVSGHAKLYTIYLVHFNPAPPRFVISMNKEKDEDE